MDLNYSSWELIGIVLERIVKNMEYSAETVCSASNFNSVRIPTISICAYLNRIHQYSSCSDSCYILAFIYLDRLLQNNPGFTLSSRNVHRLILSAVVLAIKYSDDFYADNLTYAKIGGVPLVEMNRLEIDMLKLLHYNLYVDNELYFHYAHELQLQRQKVAEENEEMECNEEYSKPIRSISSTTSIGTFSSVSEIPYD